MNFAQFATSEFGTRLWMSIGHVPPALGHAIARLITSVLSRRRHASIYRILSENQAAVLGPGATPEQLDLAVRRVLQHAGLTNYDLVRYVAQGEDALRQAIEFGPEFWPNLEAARATGRGVVVVGCHLSNFNLGFLGFALRNIPVQVLSSANPVGGFQLMHELRARGLLEETPIDAQALRAAIRRLRGGGVAVTGVDWPVPTPEEERVPFFGRPSYAPTGHIRLAMSANAILWPIACRWTPERGYFVLSAPPMELELTGDRAADVTHNARRVLAVMERWIAETPDQWLMYHRVWPEGGTTQILSRMHG